MQIKKGFNTRYGTYHTSFCTDGGGVRKQSEGKTQEDSDARLLLTLEKTLAETQEGIALLTPVPESRKET